MEIAVFPPRTAPICLCRKIGVLAATFGLRVNCDGCVRIRIRLRGRERHACEVGLRHLPEPATTGRF